MRNPETAPESREAELLAAEFSRPLAHIKNVIALIDEGNTIPFIARYRKEQHGSMDDQLLRELSERLAYLRNLSARRGEIRSSVEQQGKLTEELSAAIEAAATLAELEDIYRPYRPKRRTRASIAREKGLEELAALLLEQNESTDPEAEARRFLDSEKGLESTEEALAGARDIIAEDVSDEAALRKRLRALVNKRGQLRSEAARDEKSVYENYYDFTEPVSRLQSHRVLALNRGEREGFLKVSLELPDEEALKLILDSVIKNGSRAALQVREACEDSYSRLIFSSLERELRSSLTESANEQAIKTFALNLKPLLMQPPVKGRVTMGLDPGYRTGCKVAVVDATGRVLDTGVIYPTKPHSKTEEAKTKLLALIKKHGVEVISIGNGTASRETEAFVAGLIKGSEVKYMIVSEAGASVYSASKLAAAEFPDYDVSLRSAVSIARRLQDPLAELVKIDPKSIGVGQYQHDMPQQRLSEALDGVVESCVNSVGADLNTASAALLARIAGIGPAVAGNIVARREENGAFKSRKELLKVPKLGAKAFEQCAGFVRVPESANPLDNTGVHPESYKAAEKLLELSGYSLKDAKAGLDLEERAAELSLKKLAEGCGVGEPTLKDIISELKKPGRDPREELPPPLLRSDVLDIDDLAPGMELAGTVRNVVDFGAFVDIGVHEDGLVHISRMSSRYIKHPSEIVRTGDVVKVWVLEIEKERGRISLTMLEPSGERGKKQPDAPKREKREG
ncbi:MAG: Tex family protein [Oscillospiraceae bacterium]|nr:Tex family protein [Oscillospiraceae bacterium]